MNPNKPFFYVPHIHELENSCNNDGDKKCNDFQNHNCENITNCSNASNYPINRKFLEQCCGQYTISFPLLTFDLTHINLFTHGIIKGNLEFIFGNDNNVVYDKLYSDKLTGKKTLSCNLRNRVFKISAEECNLNLHVKGNIIYEQKKSPNDETVFNPILKTIVFNTTISLLPIEPIDSRSPQIYQILIPTIDNTGCGLINYTYVNRLFNVTNIAVNAEINLPIPDGVGN